MTQAATALSAQVSDSTPTETVEGDELYTFVQQQKNRVSVVMAVARDTGLIVGQTVSLDRGLDTLPSFAGTLPSAWRYTSDGQAAYAELIWPEGGQYVLSLGKEETPTIERVNANLRPSLKRLARRSRCFSRSLEALQRAVRLFVYYYNQRQRLYLAPHLSWTITAPLDESRL